MDITEEFENLEEKFLSLIRKMGKHLDSEKVDVVDVYDTLYHMPNSQRKIYSRYLKSDDFRRRLDKSENNRDFFRKLDDLWCFFDSYPLQRIIKEYGDEALKSDMRKYLDEVEPFCERATVSQLLKTGYRDSDIELEEKYRKCLAKFKRSEKYTINDLRNFRRQFRWCVNPLEEFTVYFFDITPGCIFVQFIVLREEADPILSHGVGEIVGRIRDRGLIEEYGVRNLILDDFILHPYNIREKVSFMISLSSVMLTSCCASVLECMQKW